MCLFLENKILRFNTSVLGPNFSFYPQDTLNLPDLKFDETGNLAFYDRDTQSLKQEFWKSTLQYGEMIKFIHQAIEWENVNYVLYPYFWTQPDKERWDFKQSLYHSDYVHRSFLRAGAARVVLTIRPGFEEAFLSFMEGEVVGEILPKNHPYMEIAKELEAMAKTKYPYTPDANVEKEEYLFSWQEIPGNHEERLLKVLKDDFYLDWAYELDENGNEKKASIAKSDNGQAIRIFNPVEEVARGNFQGGQSAVITLDNQAEKAVLQISDNKTYDLKVIQEDGELKIYKEQNWVDTWYEFTPTGALDVVDGKKAQLQ